jgi:predicted RNA-binding protein with PUA-like domain
MAKRATSGPRYWLLKSEPDCFSIDDLAKAKQQTTHWDGVRNYQARNILRDEMQVGDRAFYYHSSTDPLAIVGTVQIVKAGYPDFTQFDAGEDHYDAQSNPDDPRWYMVDVKLLQKFPTPVTRDDLKTEKSLAEMMVLQRGSRLSVQPVTPAQWKTVHKLAGVKDV